MSLHQRTLFITGASRGVGLAIALRAARDGANIAIAAKTDRPHPQLPGTIHTAAEAIEQAGGRALPLVVDIRDEEQVKRAVERTADHFGGIDILVNNASAIRLSGTLDTDMKHFDLMHQVNARGTYLCARACLPHLLQADNPHVLMLSPPLNLRPEYFGPHLAYSLAKFGMSLCTLGLAEEFRHRGVACNSLWPRTLLDTAAVRNLLGGEAMARRGRRPEIVADAAHLVLTRPAGSQTGQFLIDEAVLREAGETDFSRYRVDPALPESALQDDLFL